MLKGKVSSPASDAELIDQALAMAISSSAREVFTAARGTLAIRPLSTSQRTWIHREIAASRRIALATKAAGE